MIEDSQRAQPRFKGLNHGVQTIIAEEGYRGIFRGVGPVVRAPTLLVMVYMDEARGRIGIETRSEFGRAVLVIFHLETARARRGVARFAVAWLDDVRDRRNRRGDHGL